MLRQKHIAGGASGHTLRRWDGSARTASYLPHSCDGQKAKDRKLSTPEDIERRVRAALQELGIAGWEWIEIDPQYGDTADFCEQYGYDLPHAANTIIVTSKRGPSAFCAAIVRACDRLDVNKRVRGLMGVSRVSFASADETRELTGMMIGGVTALALPKGLPIYADSRLLEMDYIILGAGSRSGKLKVTPQELEKLPGLEFIEGLSISAQ